jgi:hypothetical protein
MPATAAPSWVTDGFVVSYGNAPFFVTDKLQLIIFILELACIINLFLLTAKRSYLGQLAATGIVDVADVVVAFGYGFGEVEVVVGDDVGGIG